MKFKNITEVEEVAEIKETDKVILNVDGKAKQANANLIKPKEEHWYIEAEGKLIGNEGPGGYYEWSIIDSNLNYNLLLEEIKKKNYPFISLGLEIKGDDEFFPFTKIAVKTYGEILNSIDNPKLEETFGEELKGISLIYDNPFLLDFYGDVCIITIKPDNSIKFFTP